jgi:trimethylamine:corrinoid methyltransferase-like protein
MPLMGATGPATVIGSAVQHAAECLSGITIHQLAKAGSPIVWGGSPASFDMRTGTTPMGAMATMMLDCTYAQIGKDQTGRPADPRLPGHGRHQDRRCPDGAGDGLGRDPGGT